MVFDTHRNRRLNTRTRLSIKHITYTPGILLLSVAITILLGGCTSDTPHVPFAGLQEKSVIYDGWNECPNGDGTYITAYQLYPVNVKQWITLSRGTGKNWIQGPVRDQRYDKAFCWSQSGLENNGPTPTWPYEQWLKSERFYFYLEDYEEFSGDGWDGTVHHSAIWVLDSKSYRLYYVAGSM